MATGEKKTSQHTVQGFMIQHSLIELSQHGFRWSWWISLGDGANLGGEDDSGD